jgi:hypothetical protein
MKEINWSRIFLMLVLCLFIVSCSVGIPIEEDEWKTTLNNCWSCSVYKTVFDAIGASIQKVFAMATNASMILLGMGLLFWILFSVSKLFISFKEPKIKEEVVKIAHVLFKALLIGAVLSSSDYLLAVIDMIVTPVITIFINMSRMIILSVNETPLVTQAISVTDTTPIFTESLSYKMQELIYRIYATLNSGMSLATFVAQERNFMGWIIFIITWGVFVYLMLVVPFIFIDAFIRIGFVILLSPFMLVAWVFPATKKWVGKAWNIFFGGMFSLFFGCIFIAIISYMITAYSDRITLGSFDLMRQTNDIELTNSFKKMEANAFAFVLLIISMAKLGLNIDTVAKAFGGDGSKSNMGMFFGQIKDAVWNTTKIVAGLAMWVSGIGASVGKSLFESGVQGGLQQIKKETEDLK